MAIQHRFAPEGLSAFARRLLSVVGVPDAHATLAAECMTGANLRGVDTHGIRLLAIYVRRLEAGAMNARPQLRILHEGPAFAVVDGDNGLGPVVGAYAMDRAIDLAARSGVAAVAARNSNHYGAAGWYATRALEKGMIGLTTSNGSPAVAPWGGRQPFFGANPLAAALPAGEESSIVFDMAASVSSRARIRERASRGEPIPEGWALDSQGRSTTDASEALGGALLPAGGAKGYGLLLILEILAGVLAGAGSSHENRDLYADLSGPQGLGHFFLALNPAAFLPDGSFGRRVDELIGALRAVPPASGTEGVRIPGDQMSLRTRQRETEGIALSPAQVEELSALGEKHAVPFPEEIL